MSQFYDLNYIFLAGEIFLYNSSYSNLGDDPKNYYSLLHKHEKTVNSSFNKLKSKWIWKALKSPGSKHFYPLFSIETWNERQMVFCTSVGLIY